MSVFNEKNEKEFCLLKSLKNNTFQKEKKQFHVVNVIFYRSAGSGDSGSFTWRYLTYAQQEDWFCEMCMFLTVWEQNTKEIIQSIYDRIILKYIFVYFASQRYCCKTKANVTF